MDTENELLKDVCTSILKEGVDEEKIIIIEETLLTMLNRTNYDTNVAMLMEYLVKNVIGTSTLIPRIHTHIYNSTIRQFAMKFSDDIGTTPEPIILKDMQDIILDTFRNTNNKYETGGGIDGKE